MSAMPVPKLDLAGEQILRALDLIRAEIKALRVELVHTNELSACRLSALEKTAGDHESRLRGLNDQAQQTRALASLLGGSSFVAALGALLRSFFGG